MQVLLAKLRNPAVQIEIKIIVKIKPIEKKTTLK